LRPEDIARLHVPSDPRLHPDGDRVFFTVSTPNVADDRYDRVIWVHDSSGARPFTAGPGDLTPRVSPDGRTLAFLRIPEGAKFPQAAVIPLDGGEARILTDFVYGVDQLHLEWSPDGSRLVVVGITPTAEWEGLEEDEKKRRPRRITKVPYRFDNRGGLDDRRRHLWAVDPAGTTDPVCLTKGEWDEEYPAWSPDGSRIAFLSDRDPAGGLAAGTDAWELTVGTGEVARALPRGWWAYLSYRPDGTLHALGQPGTDYPVVYSLYRRDPDGSLSCLTEAMDRSHVSLAGGPPFVRWDGDDAVVGLETAGTHGVVRVSPDGESEAVIDRRCQVTGLDVADDRMVFTMVTARSPGEVYSMSRGTEDVLTELNVDDLGIIEPDHFKVTCDDGETELDVWVILPPGEKSVPLLLNIHGGPASQYGHAFFDEFQVYAGAGYGVVYSNPRGSSGRGLDFVRAVTGDGWGTVDLADTRTVVAAALARHPRLDPERMGIMGGSYGGFLTAWVIGHESRWKSAVVERALISWTSFSGTSDIGGVFPANYTHAEYPDGWDDWWRMSPLALAHQVTTPTLVLHSEEDYRCPIEQAEQYFMALLRNGTTTEFVRFPGEGHEMSRAGKPRHRVERFKAILDWHSRHLA
jgi:dipeptidyl aminopeptidase/acylaminoacyl peptidase